MRGRALTTFIAAVVVIGVATACETTTEATATYKATLTGANEVPAVTTSGTGTWNASFDQSSNVLTYTLTYSGLGTAATMAHIHGPAAVGVTAGILVDFATSTVTGRTLTLGTSGSGSGAINLSVTSPITATVSGDSLRKLLDSGNAYVNIHTATNGGGEIRGQIIRQ
jgi:hypothetical protein